MAISSRLRRLQERKKTYRRTTSAREPTPTKGGTHRRVNRYRGFRVAHPAPKAPPTEGAEPEDDGTRTVRLEVEIRGPDEPVNIAGLQEAIDELESEGAGDGNEAAPKKKKASRRKATKLRKVEDDG